jgi:hypothetical protein
VKSEEESGTFNLTGGNKIYQQYQRFPQNIPQYNLESRNEQARF